MLTYENAVCFVLGMLVVYLMFRMMGIFVVFAFLSISLNGHAQTNPVEVVNWPYDQSEYTNTVPVTVTEENAPDRWPAVAAGMGFGFTCAGFGWILRMGKRTATGDF